MLDGGDVACAMEVSSHALAYGRADGIRLQVKVFTNLTQDHLDFHSDMEDYFLAKRRPSAGGAASRGTAVVNVDDPYGARLAAELRKAEAPLLTFSAEEPRRTSGCRGGQLRCDRRPVSVREPRW